LRINALLPDLAGNALTTFLQVLFTTQP
jgi:hypothetical protein